MASQSAQFDLTTAFLGQPKTLAYGLVRGSGNLVFQQDIGGGERAAFYLLGEGMWDSILRIWINAKQVSLPFSRVRFHPGDDGEIGSGMAAVSTGGDQHVDTLFGLVPGGLSPVTWSRYAYLGIDWLPDPGAPTADLTVLADYRAMKCRIFDNAGVQTAFQWTQNPAWWICDFIIRKFILREAKINQPLVAAEKARFDWPSFKAAANYFDVDIGGGIPRFSDGGLVLMQSGLTAAAALEQMLLMCRSYTIERNGKICLYPDQARASVFTFGIDNVLAGSFQANKTNLRQQKNRITPTWREEALAASSSDDATRFAIITKSFDHEAHQRTIGARGPGLSVIPKAQELQLDFGVNTAERVYRLCQHELIRQLGIDVDVNTPYLAPFQAQWTGYEDSLAVEPGDLVTIDPSISEEFGGKLFEALEIVEKPDGTRDISALEYEPNAFPDSAPSQQQTQAPDPGKGLPVVTGNSNRAYRPLGNYLSATDAGATATINIAPGTNRVSGIGDISVGAGSIGALLHGTLYFLNYADPDLLGGSVTYSASTTQENAIGDGKFFWGSIQTPLTGGQDTVGNNDGGAGAQVGGASIFSFTDIMSGGALFSQLNGNGTINNPYLAIDGDSTTHCDLTVTGNSAGPTNIANFHTGIVLGIGGRYTSIKVKILYEVPVNSLNGGFSNAIILNVALNIPGLGGAFVNFQTVIFAGGAGAVGKTLLIVNVPVDQGFNYAYLGVFASVEAVTADTAGTATLRIWDTHVEAVG